MMEHESMPGIREDAYFQCLLCDQVLSHRAIAEHKSTYHSDLDVYGFMRYHQTDDLRSAFAEDLDRFERGQYTGIKGSRTLARMSALHLDDCVLFADDGNAEGDNPIHRSEVIAKTLGVRDVYIRDEGQNPTGSLKDYMVAAAVTLGMLDGADAFTTVSSGNHAVALARYAERVGRCANVFIPYSSSKAALLESLPNVEVFRMTDGKDGSACYEDVYEAHAKRTDAGYNANASNEFIYDLIQQACIDTALKLQGRAFPTHVLTGVGNGSYVGMLGKGFRLLARDGIIPHVPRMVPVGMDGGFPLETCVGMQRRHIFEYRDFRSGIEGIESAEGSIAIASYSMPHAVRAVRETNGMTLGGMRNEDLADAYRLLMQDPCLLDAGAIPEPTGIMSLAAAIKHRGMFDPDDVLLLCFTGHAAKDEQEITHLLGAEGDDLVDRALSSRADIRIPPRSHIIAPDQDISNILGENDGLYAIRS